MCSFKNQASTISWNLQIEELKLAVKATRLDREVTGQSVVVEDVL